mgnify:CR=1 FL=1
MFQYCFHKHCLADNLRRSSLSAQTLAGPCERSEKSPDIRLALCEKGWPSSSLEKISYAKFYFSANICIKVYNGKSQNSSNDHIIGIWLIDFFQHFAFYCGNWWEQIWYYGIWSVFELQTICWVQNWATGIALTPQKFIFSTCTDGNIFRKSMVVWGGFKERIRCLKYTRDSIAKVIFRY